MNEHRFTEKRVVPVMFITLTEVDRDTQATRRMRFNLGRIICYGPLVDEEVIEEFGKLAHTELCYGDGSWAYIHEAVEDIDRALGFDTQPSTPARKVSASEPPGKKPCPHPDCNLVARVVDFKGDDDDVREWLYQCDAGHAWPQPTATEAP